ncbi:MAG TPA: ABC transporter permease [Puia sp.]|nr:ABC transporter permease [Puia sp.]
MLKNHFKLAWRNLLKDRQFSFLNLIGLSTGLACVLLIYLWVAEELHVDKFFANDNRLYQVMKTAPNADGTISTYEFTQGILGEKMANELSEVQYATSVRREELSIIAAGDKKIKATPEFISKDFFKVFSYQLTEGNKIHIFPDKFGVLLSDKLAFKLFGTTSGIIGKTIEWSYGGEFDGLYKVAGVFSAPPANVRDQADILFSYDMLLSKEATDMAFWGSNSEFTYLLLKSGTDISRFNKKIKDFTKNKIKAQYGIKSDLLPWEGDVFVRRFSDRYLYGKYQNGVQAGGRIEYVKLFSLIAIFLLFIACINFMNLSTARASRRLKEVGVKKVVGASRISLIFQFLSESMLMAFSSGILAILFATFLLPAFRQITGKAFTFDLNAALIFSIIGITLFTGFIAGSYPALYLSRFRPALVLKGSLNVSAGEAWIRKGLVIFQFSISIILIVSVLVVYQQMKMIQTKNLGYNKDNVIRFANEGNLKKNLSSFLATLKSIPGVVNASDASGDFFGNTNHGGSGISWDGKDPHLGIEYNGIDVDYDYMELMNLQMDQGRYFSKNFSTDSSAVIFNQTAIAAMGIKDPVGKAVSLWGKKKTIVGIAKDYHFKSMYQKIGPAFLALRQNNDHTLVKIKAGMEKQTLSRVENLFKKYNAGLSFEYTFLDDDYAALYFSEQKVAVLSRYFAGIAIIISCLGLFGLAAFTAQKRQKEIGIRKIVGATVSNIALMLSKDFFKLILVSLFIAFPISWWAMNEWLQGFAYRIHMSPFIFFIAGFSILVMTLLTISFQSIKAAIANPAKSLRSE